MATEEGNAAPSFRPLWTIMPYLWPKGRPDLRVRVIVSIVFLILATSATSYSPLFFGRAVDALTSSKEIAGRATLVPIALGYALSMIAAYIVSRILMQAFAQLRAHVRVGLDQGQVLDAVPVQLEVHAGPGADLDHAASRSRQQLATHRAEAVLLGRLQRAVVETGEGAAPGRVVRLSHRSGGHLPS